MTSPEPTPVPIRPTGAQARVDLAVDVVFHPVKREPEPHLQRGHSFLIEPYTVDSGVPRDRPAVGVLGQGVTGIGRVEWGDTLVDPQQVFTGASVRWLPTEETFTHGVEWRPYTGTDALKWVAGETASPYLDPAYSYERGRTEFESSAMVFDGGAWMRMNTAGMSRQQFAIGMVVVPKAGFGAHYAIVESNQAPVPDLNENSPNSTPVDLALRYAHGRVSVVTGGRVVGYQTRAQQATPMVLVLSLATTGGRLAVYDGQRSTRTFSMSNVSAFDVDLFLGRSGLNYDISSTAVMDVLEIDFWDRSLRQSDVEDYLNLMASVYGISS